MIHIEETLSIDRDAMSHVVQIFAKILLLFDHLLLGFYESVKSYHFKFSLGPLGLYFTVLGIFICCMRSFGPIGIRRFVLRGLEKVTLEFGLIAMGHTI